MRDFAFAQLTDEQTRLIETVEIGDTFVTKDQADAIREGLGLAGMGFEELTAVRNSVVRHLADLGNEAREAGDWGTFDRTRNNMSGITAVIDQLIYC